MSIVLAFEHYGKFSFSRWGASSMAAQVRWHLRQFSGKQLWQKDNTMACLKTRVILLCTRSHIQWLKHRPKANKERLLQGGTKVSLRPKQKLEFLREFDSFGLFISSGYKNRVFLMIRVSFRHSKLAHCDIDEKFCLTPSQGFESARSQKNGYYSATV